VPALDYDSISMCTLEDDAPDRPIDDVLSFNELHSTESPMGHFRRLRRHKSAGSSTDDKHSLRLGSHHRFNPIQNVRINYQGTRQYIIYKLSRSTLRYYST
jgi:hypothetical protein